MRRTPHLTAAHVHSPQPLRVRCGHMGAWVVCTLPTDSQDTQRLHLHLGAAAGLHADKCAEQAWQAALPTS